MTNTHLDFRPDDAERLMNVADLIRVCERYGERPTLICGDFNDIPGSRTHQSMQQRFTDSWERVGQGEGYTFSSIDPLKRTDYIFVGNHATVNLVKAWVVSSTASDHHPVVLELTLRD